MPNIRAQSDITEFLAYLVKLMNIHALWQQFQPIAGLRRFASRMRADQSGAVAILFGVMFIVIAMFGGLAIDYARAERAKSRISAAANSANLVAAKAAATLAAADPTLSQSEIKTQAEEQGTRFFEANIGNHGDFTIRNYNIVVNRQPGTWTATSNFSATSPVSLLALTGMDEIALAGQSSASIKPGVPVLDIAMCINSTGSMTPTLDAVKANATTFYDNLSTELTARGVAPFAQVRVRIAFFKDYGDEVPGFWDPDPMRASGFFALPDQSADFLNFAAPQVAYGGGDWPEADAICLNEAMDSAWMQPGDVIPSTGDRVTDVYPLIVVWTDSPAHGVGFANYEANPDYPAPDRMPRTYDEFLAKWNNPAVIDQTNKQILFFGDPTLDDPAIADRSAWLTIKDWPSFSVGGTLLEGNTEMVEFLAEGISHKVRGLSITN